MDRIRIPLNDVDGLLGAVSMKHGIAFLSQRFDNDLAYDIFVFYDENRFSAAHGVAAVKIPALGIAGLVGTWEIKPEGGSTTRFAFDHDVSAGLLDDAIDIR